MIFGEWMGAASGVPAREVTLIAAKIHCRVRDQGTVVAARRDFSIVRTILERFPIFEKEPASPDPCHSSSKANDRFLTNVQMG
jgi:hypothetical protein